MSWKQHMSLGQFAHHLRRWREGRDDLDIKKDASMTIIHSNPQDQWTAIENGASGASQLIRALLKKTLNKKMKKRRGRPKTKTNNNINPDPTVDQTKENEK